MSEQNEIKLHALDYWQVIRNRYGVILLAFFLVFMTAVVIAYLRPSEYLGKTQIQVKREATEMNLFRESGSVGTTGGAGLPYMTFMQTQFEIIKSQKTLDLVVEKLGLDKEWNMTKYEAFLTLQSKLETENVRGTDLIEIEVYHTEASLAAKMADAVAEAYETRRVTEEKNRADKALDTLETQIASQQDKLEKSRVKMLDIMEQYNIVDLSLGGPAWLRGNQPDTGISTLVMDSKRREFNAEINIQDLRTTIGALADLDGNQLIESAVDLGVQNPTLTTRYPEYQNLQLMRTQLLNSGLLPKHPKVVAVDRQIEQIRGFLVDAVEVAKNALTTQLAMAEQTFKNAEKVKQDTEKDSLAERRQNIVYIEAKKDYELNKEVLNSMQAQLAKEKIDSRGMRAPIVIHEHAVIPTAPARPNVKLHLILGAVVGLIFGVVMAFFLEYLDTSVKTLEDVERYLEVPVLAVIPKDVGVLHKQSGLSPDAEAYRILRTNIEFNRKSADANSITVVSGGAGEGKSTTLVNLAYVCAQGGYNTLMIDGDLRRPKLHTFFDINNSVGLTNYLTTDLMLEDVILQTPVENLYFMPSGILPADAAGILNSRRMSELIADVKSRFDLVLIDSPPILGVSDASVLASEVDLTMIVIQHRKLPRGMLIRVKQAIENVGGNLLGVVLNNVDVRSDSQYQYYTSYYTYYSPTNTDAKPKARDAAPAAGDQVAQSSPAPSGEGDDF
jgi:capsular exopolysaccharide synthesis family protein